MYMAFIGHQVRPKRQGKNIDIIIFPVRVLIVVMFMLRSRYKRFYNIGFFGHYI